MLYALGVGEIADLGQRRPARRDGALTQTIRAVGAVSRALHGAGRAT